MHKIVIYLVILATSLVTAQTSYETGMKKAFELWEQNKTVEASNLFERIAKAETDNWLPAYYASQVLIMDGFSKLKDKEALETQLTKAQELLNNATAISKENVEIMVLQAVLHTVYVASDGATYGMTLAPKVSKIYAEAYKLDPTNPRVVLNKADWDMGSARYFGQDTAPFCKDIEKSIELFANFKPETEFHPNWGKERAEEVLKECKK